MNLRKYPNRKLYNTDISKYVNLTQVIAHLRQGGVIQVTTPSGKSATHEVLNQALLKCDLPNEVIVSLIRGESECQY